MHRGPGHRTPQPTGTAGQNWSCPKAPAPAAGNPVYRFEHEPD